MHRHSRGRFRDPPSAREPVVLKQNSEISPRDCPSAGYEGSQNSQRETLIKWVELGPRKGDPGH
jgi:hypothetical protein